VKNNLQVVISLLALQRRAISEDAARCALEDSERRVMSMSLVHELLYRGDDLAAIRLNEYLTDLTHAIVATAVHDQLEIIPQFSFAAERPLPLDIAIPLGIVVTEILTNAAKHAFTGRHRGTLTISTTGTDDEHLSVTICDDGCGMPDVDRIPGSSLGMELVGTLCHQLEAAWKLTPGPDGAPGFAGTADAVGTCFSLPMAEHPASQPPSPPQP
jgi:two-component sensor histidine kinase